MGPGEPSAGTLHLDDIELADAWLESDPRARWRVARPRPAPAAPMLVLFEIAPGHRLAAHEDSADETLVVLAGEVEVRADGRTARAGAGGVLFVPARVRHEVRAAGGATARVLGVFAARAVTSTFEEPVMPDGRRVRGGAPAR